MNAFHSLAARFGDLFHANNSVELGVVLAGGATTVGTLNCLLCDTASLALANFNMATHDNFLAGCCALGNAADLVDLRKTKL